MEYCNFSWEAARELPVPYRKWFIQRKQKEIEKKAEAEKQASKDVPGATRQMPPKTPPARPAKR